MRASSVVGLLATVGCAASHDLPPDLRPVDPADLALYAELFDTTCDRALRCERSTWLSQYACDPGTRGYRLAQIASRAAHVDHDAARECLEGVRAMETCVYRAEVFTSARHPARLAWLDALELACERAFVVDGQACDGDVCSVGDRCELDSSCHGHCVGLPEAELAQLGEPCTDEIRCGPHLRCRRTSDLTGVCEADCYAEGLSACRRAGGEQCAGTSAWCVAAPTAGEACVELPDGERTCEIESTCELTTGLCRARRGVGEPCDPAERDPGCGSGLVCERGTRSCAAGGGEPCDVLGCPLGEHCHADGTCSSDPQGAPCRAEYVWPAATVIAWIDSCPEGYACTALGGSGRCRRVVAAGEPCPADVACAEGTVCRGGICADSSWPFEPCASSADCPDDHTCDSGVCHAPLLDCVDGACTWGACVDGRCRYLPVGSPCPTGRECRACMDDLCAEPGSGALGDVCTGAATTRFCNAAAGLSCRDVVGPGARCCPGP